MASTFKNTIDNFMNSFKDYHQIRDQILNASVLLITQADCKAKMEDIKNIIMLIKKSHEES